MNSKHRIVYGVVLGSLLRAWTLADADESETQRLDALDQKVRVLERKLELADEAAQAKAKDAPTVTAGKEGFSLASADKSFQLKIRGYSQFDGRLYLGDSAVTANDTFLLRRARLFFDGRITKDFEFLIVPDFGNGQSALQDGYLDYKPTPGANVRLGRAKSPFGTERLQSSADTAFTELALPSALGPAYDVGAQLYGSAGAGVLDYAVGVFNGVPDGANGDVDANDGKDLVGRVFLTPFKNSDLIALSGLSFGVAGSVGDQTGTRLQPGLPVLKSSGQQAFFGYRVSTNTDATAYADGARTRLSPQFYYTAGPLGLLGEYVVSAQEVAVGEASDSLQNDAWSLTASYVLTGESPSLKGVKPLAPFAPEAGKWGAVELVGRYGALNIDDAAFTGGYADPKKSATAARNWGAGVNWYLTQNVKLVADYEQTSFDGGASGGDRPTETLVSTRAQLAF